MVPLKELQDWLLDELHRSSKGTSINHALVTALDETHHVLDAVQLSGRLIQQKDHYGKTIDKIREKIEASFHWDIWAYRPLERVEGPYRENEAHSRMLKLMEQTGRPHIRVIVGSEQEGLFQTAISSSSKKAEST